MKRRAVLDHDTGGGGGGGGGYGNKTLRGGTSESASEQQRRSQFLGALVALNRQFAAWVKATVAANPSAPLIDAGNDYLQYVRGLEERYLRTYGEVFTFGSGECGQLAHGVEHEKDLSVRVPRIVKSLRDKRVRQVACGGIHSVAVGDDGRVWTWGCNDDGALGRPTGPVDPERPEVGSQGDENLPALVQGLPDQVCHVACGDSQTLVLTAGGACYGWGCYKDKEGRKWFDRAPGAAAASVKRQQGAPMVLEVGGLCDDVKCGASFNLALLKDGSVRTWGLGEVGDLGRPAPPLRNAQGEYQFADIAAQHLTPAAPQLKGGGPLPVIKATGTGMWHLFLVVAEGGAVLTAGLNNYGQLGLGDEVNRDALEPVALLDGVGVTEIGGGQHHSLAIASASPSPSGTGVGRVVAWGRADYGQLGVGTAIDVSSGACHSTPLEVVLPAGAGTPLHMSCGENHNLVLTAKHQVYSWGFGEMGSLGHAGDDDELSPRLMDKLADPLVGLGHVTVLQLAGGGQHSILLGRAVE